jgi:hypothetical protein
VTKKVRGSGGRHRRPGARPPSERVPGIKRRPTADIRPSQLEVAEEVAELIVDDRPAEAANELERTARTIRPHQRIKANSLLATRAATEYVYVAKDMRRILFVAALLVAVMLALWLLLVVMKVVPLPFY